jgi:hypothetical protein
MATKMEVSATDLRRQLYDQLRTAGVVDNLKTHLRSQMLCQLQEHQPTLLVRASEESSHSIWHRVANSLVADYLKFSKMNYTLSLFLVSWIVLQSKHACASLDMRLRRGLPMAARKQIVFF